MEQKEFEAFARGLGGLPSAIEDIVRRAQHHFGDTEPDAETLTAWGRALTTTSPHLFVPPTSRTTLEEVAAKHGMPLALWQSLSPAERYTREKALSPPVQRHKPGTYLATGEELQALKGKSLHEQLTFAHEKAQQQP